MSEEVKKDGPADKQDTVKGVKQAHGSAGIQTKNPDPQADLDGDGEEGEDGDYRLFTVKYEGHVGDRIQLSFNHNNKDDVRGVIVASAIKDFDKKNLTVGNTYNLRIKAPELTQMLIDTGEGQ